MKPTPTTPPRVRRADPAAAPYAAFQAAIKAWRAANPKTRGPVPTHADFVPKKSKPVAPAAAVVAPPAKPAPPAPVAPASAPPPPKPAASSAAVPEIPPKPVGAS